MQSQTIEGRPGGGMIALSREERDILRQEVNVDMNGIGDLALVANQGSTADLVAMRRRFWGALHLLDDLGWPYDDPRDTFYVTLPADELRRWLQEILGTIDYELGVHAECFAVAGHVGQLRVGRALTDEEAADELREARRYADRELDLRALCLALVARLDAEQVA